MPSRPDGRWKFSRSFLWLDSDPGRPVWFQRPSGRESLAACIPVGAPQSRLPAGYFPPPIRAKTERLSDWHLPKLEFFNPFSSAQNLQPLSSHFTHFLPLRVEARSSRRQLADLLPDFAQEHRRDLAEFEFFRFVAIA